MEVRTVQEDRTINHNTLIRVKTKINYISLSSPNIRIMIKSRRMRWAGHVARIGEKRNAYRILVGKPEERKQLGRPRRRWVDNIKIDLREIGWNDMDWRGLVNTVMNLRVP
jgi:hypothetical protein